MRPCEALEFNLAALSEGDIRAGHELADEARDEHLAGDSVARDSGRVVDSRSVEVICLVKRVARVRADADAQWWRCARKRGVNRHVDRSRTRNGTPRTRKGEHRTVALSLDNRPTVCCGRISDYLVVLADDVEPAVIAQPAGQDGRVDDVREDDRHRSIGGERLVQIGPVYPDLFLELLEADGQLASKHLLVRDPCRQMKLHDFPLAALEVQDPRDAKVGRLLRHTNEDPGAGPADAPFLPGFDLVPLERKASGLFPLRLPNGAMLAVPPLGVVGAHGEHARMLREPAEACFGVGAPCRRHKAVDDTTDLRRRLHAQRLRRMPSKFETPARPPRRVCTSARRASFHKLCGHYGGRCSRR